MKNLKFMKISTPRENRIVDYITGENFTDKERFTRIATYIINRQAKRQSKLIQAEQRFNTPLILLYPSLHQRNNLNRNV